MRLKEHDLITTGLSSEVFLHAFLEPSSGYAIARKLEKHDGPVDKSKIPKNFHKVHDALNALIAEGYIAHDFDKKKHYPKLERVVWDFGYLIQSKGKSVDEKELQLLANFLTHRDFLKTLSAQVLDKMKKQPKGTHKINALQIFSNKIGFLAALFLFARTHLEEFKKEFSINPDFSNAGEALFQDLDKEWDKVIEEIDIKFDDLFRTNFPLNPEIKERFDPVVNFLKSMPSMIILLVAPETTLEKFSLLWDQYEGFQLGIDLALGDIKKYHKVI